MGAGILDKIFGSPKPKGESSAPAKTETPKPKVEPEKNVITNIKDKKKAMKEIMAD